MVTVTTILRRVFESATRATLERGWAGCKDDSVSSEFNNSRHFERDGCMLMFRSTGCFASCERRSMNVLAILRSRSKR